MLTLDSWILNGVVDSLCFLVTIQAKALICLSVPDGNENKAAQFTSSYNSFLLFKLS